LKKETDLMTTYRIDAGNGVMAFAGRPGKRTQYYRVNTILLPIVSLRVLEKDMYCWSLVTNGEI